MGYLDCKWTQRELLDTQIVPVVGQMLIVSVDYQMYGRVGKNQKECAHLVVMISVVLQLPSVLYHKKKIGWTREKMHNCLKRITSTTNPDKSTTTVGLLIPLSKS